VQQIGAGSPLRLTTDSSDDYSPVWSPDGRSIAFLRQKPDERLSELRPGRRTERSSPRFSRMEIFCAR
jgi:Tol biopolymer transport system component